MGAGCLFFAADDHELKPDRIAVRSEGIGNGALRWRFDADSSDGQPLEAVFYTLEYTPCRAENAANIVVRLYDTPAAGRSKLRRTGERGNGIAEFDLVYRLPSSAGASPLAASYYITFCGRNLGEWKANAEEALAAALTAAERH